MPRRPRILIVVHTTPLGNVLATWLSSGPYDLAVVNAFPAAKVHVDMEPDLLITELKLGEYNGLHLALRARANSLPAMVIGDPDPVLERDAFEFGATFLHAAELRRDEFLRVVERVIASHLGASTRDRLAWTGDSSAFVPAERPPSAFHATGHRPLLH